MGHPGIPEWPVGFGFFYADYDLFRLLQYKIKVVPKLVLLNGEGMIAKIQSPNQSSESFLLEVQKYLVPDLSDSLNKNKIFFGGNVLFLF